MMYRSKKLMSKDDNLIRKITKRLQKLDLGRREKLFKIFDAGNKKCRLLDERYINIYLTKFLNIIERHNLVDPEGLSKILKYLKEIKIGEN